MEENEFKFKCEKCEYYTNFKSSYDKHLTSSIHQTGERKVRTDKKDPKCDKCNYECSSQQSLREHILNLHSTKEEREKEFKFYCKSCDFGKMNEKQFEVHLNSNKHKRIVGI